MTRIQIKISDITKEHVDAIVNAANASLLGGGGVDGAIHRAGGPRLLEECRSLGGCKTGQAKITNGYNLPTKYVIHTVGPVWHGGRKNEDQLLATCYTNSLKIAKDHGLKTIAFSAISTGVYRFPIDRAAKIAIKTIKAFLVNNPEIDKVVFVCFSRDVYDSYLNNDARDC